MLAKQPGGEKAGAAEAGPDAPDTGQPSARGPTLDVHVLCERLRQLEPLVRQALDDGPPAASSAEVR